jgi:hypothetical protein
VTQHTVVDGGTVAGTVMDDRCAFDGLAGLEDALASELRLLGDLTAILRRQRDAVAANDVEAVDDSTFATHRVLLTLGEARRRRRRVFELLRLSDTLPLNELAAELGDRFTPALRHVLDELQGIAVVVTNEVATNRLLLRGAIASGDSLVRALASAAPAERVTHHPGGAPSAGAAFINRTI